VQQKFDTRLEELQGVVWDLDNTLYRLDEVMAQAFHRAVARAALEGGVKLDIEEASAVARQAFLNHGYSGWTFVQQYGIDEVWLHHKFHDYIDEAVIQANQDVVHLFGQVGLRHALITHGSATWAQRVLQHLGLKPWFDPSCILGLEDYEFRKKSDSAASFIAAIERLGIEPEKLLFVEDTAKNLAIPYDLGMGTVLLHHGQRPAKVPPYIDADYDNAVQLLQDIVQRKMNAATGQTA
jgi:putative hydrolase of the HAD superfamily